MENYLLMHVQQKIKGTLEEENIFKTLVTKARSKKLCTLIINEGSTENVLSIEIFEKLHQHQIAWLNNHEQHIVKHQMLVTFFSICGLHKHSVMHGVALMSVWP